MNKSMEEIVDQCIESLHQLGPAAALHASAHIASCIIWQSTHNKSDALKVVKVCQQFMTEILDGLTWDDITEETEQKQKPTAKKKQKVHDKTMYS